MTNLHFRKKSVKEWCKKLISGKRGTFETGAMIRRCGHGEKEGNENEIR